MVYNLPANSKLVVRLDVKISCNGQRPTGVLQANFFRAEKIFSTSFELLFDGNQVVLLKLLGSLQQGAAPPPPPSTGIKKTVMKGTTGTCRVNDVAILELNGCDVVQYCYYMCVSAARADVTFSDDLGTGLLWFSFSLSLSRSISISIFECLSLQFERFVNIFSFCSVDKN